jgi:dihydroflavonol-4-reductase
MKVLLTGATGFLGNNILRALLDEGHAVTVLVRQSSDPRPTDGLKVEKVFADLANPSEVSRAVIDTDVLIHSAALIQIGWSQLPQSLSVNVEATRILAEAARRQNVRMIHVSTVDTLAVGHVNPPADETCFAPPKPQSSYVVSKTKAEQAVLHEVSHGLDAVVVNPGFMVGPWDWKPSSGEMMLAIAKRFVPFAPAGGCTVVDVRDVAEGVISAMKHGRTGERYILGGENLNYLDLWTMMAKTAGRKPPQRVLPNWLAHVAGKSGDLLGKLKKNEPQVNSAATAMGQLFHFYSSEKAQRELGYQIGSIQTALTDAWEWFKAYGYV